MKYTVQYSKNQFICFKTFLESIVKHNPGAKSVILHFYEHKLEIIYSFFDTQTDRNIGDYWDYKEGNLPFLFFSYMFETAGEMNYTKLTLRSETMKNGHKMIPMRMSIEELQAFVSFASDDFEEYFMRVETIKNKSTNMKENFFLCQWQNGESKRWKNFRVRTVWNDYKMLKKPLNVLFKFDIEYRTLHELVIWWHRKITEIKSKCDNRDFVIIVPQRREGEIQTVQFCFDRRIFTTCLFPNYETDSHNKTVYFKVRLAHFLELFKTKSNINENCEMILCEDRVIINTVKNIKCDIAISKMTMRFFSSMVEEEEVKNILIENWDAIKFVNL